jgi:hypothetical protein
MSKIEVDQIDPQSGTTLTLGTSGDTVTIPSGVSLAPGGGLTLTGNFVVDGGTVKLDGNYPVGTDNVALGDTALDSVEAGGINNVAIGDHAGTAITTGDNNIAIGKDALETKHYSFCKYSNRFKALRNNTSGFQTQLLGFCAIQQVQIISL